MLKFIDEYRDIDLCLETADKIKAVSQKKINIMEICGGHTMAIRKNGLHKLVGGNINFISGPGCPVCVTSIDDTDTAIALSKIKGTVVCSFGDLLYVPGTNSTLAKSKAEGADVRIVYSVYDVLNFAREETDKNFIFISLGFETTAPAAALAVLQADEERLDNFYILTLNKTMPYALRAILSNNSRINGLLCPGHVSAVTGINMYKFIADEFGIPCCVSGFEPLDILASIYILTELCEKGRAEVVNAYRRVVLDTGNEKAQFVMSKVFEKSDAVWRGIGLIKLSGLRLRPPYDKFEARENFKIDSPKSKGEENCVCAEILRGMKQPKDCPLFSMVCTPLNPKGACMVSSEGTCAAWYRYGN